MTTRRTQIRMIGRRVKLLRDLKTLYKVFRAGKEFRVRYDEGTRKGLTLTSVTNPAKRILHVAHSDVELLGPPPEKSVRKINDWKGRRARLWCDLRTKDGIEFKAGEIMIVEQVWRGKLHATREADMVTRSHGRGSIRHVEEDAFELLD